MKTVSVAEARSRLKALLDDVSSGQKVSVVRRGREVARLVPPRPIKRRLPASGIVPGIDSCDERAGEPDGRPCSSERALLMYIDTSLLVPYYCPEALSQVAERTLRSDSSPTVSDLIEVEFFSALARKVRMKDMSATDARRTGLQFVDHLQAGLYARIAIERRHYDAARAWLARFSLPLQTLDALHLAVADLEGLRLATADRDLSRCARRLGVAVTLWEES